MSVPWWPCFIQNSVKSETSICSTSLQLTGKPQKVQQKNAASHMPAACPGFAFYYNFKIKITVSLRTRGTVHEFMGVFPLCSHYLAVCVHCANNVSVLPLALLLKGTSPALVVSLFEHFTLNKGWNDRNLVKLSLTYCFECAFQTPEHPSFCMYVCVEELHYRYFQSLTHDQYCQCVLE